MDEKEKKNVSFSRQGLEFPSIFGIFIIGRNAPESNQSKTGDMEWR